MADAVPRLALADPMLETADITVNPSRFLADKTESIGSSGIRRAFELAATMKDPINLSIGQPDFPVPDRAKRAAIEAIESDRNGYTVTGGLPELRERIAADLRDEFDWSPEVFVTCGVSGGLVLALMACLNPGDEVIFADPYFVSYKHLVNLLGGRAVGVEIYDDFKLDPAVFAKAITPRTKIILLNSPANPTGIVHGKDEIRGIAELARRNDLLVVSDEIYNQMSYDAVAASPVSFAPERTLLLRGFSKTYAMTGWRLGYAAGPTAIVRAMVKLQQSTFVCAPHMAQVGAIAACDVDMSSHVRDYRRKRDLVVDALQGAYELVRPAGGFYVFPKVPSKYGTASAFVEECIRHNVLVIAGSVFSERDTHFRISYAVPDEMLRRGCDVLLGLAG